MNSELNGDQRELMVLRETIGLLLIIIDQFTIIDLPSAKRLKVQLAKIRLLMEQPKC